MPRTSTVDRLATVAQRLPIVVTSVPNLVSMCVGWPCWSREARDSDGGCVI